MLYFSVSLTRLLTVTLFSQETSSEKCTEFSDVNQFPHPLACSLLKISNSTLLERKEGLIPLHSRVYTYQRKVTKGIFKVPSHKIAMITSIAVTDDRQQG